MKTKPQTTALDGEPEVMETPAPEPAAEAEAEPGWLWVVLSEECPVDECVDAQTHLVVTRQAQRVREALVGSGTRLNQYVVIKERRSA